MRRSIRTAVIAVILAMAVIVVAISLPSVFAAEKLNLLGAQTYISYQVYAPPAEQKKELDNLGLSGKVNEDGTVTLQPTATGTFDKISAVKSSTMEERHKQLIETGVLRYAIYSGALCQQASAGLIIILDFSNYNVSAFESDFLNSLTYVLLGSREMLGRGKTFYEKNYDGGALTIYDSANNGTPVTEKYDLTLQGIYANDSSNNSYLAKAGDANEANRRYINNYSIRIVLPRNLQTAITLKSRSLTLEGFDFLGFSPKQPDSIGLGISHLDINPKDHASSIVIANDAATTMHFHWMSVLSSQKQFSLLRSLNNMLGINGASVNTGYVDEIFIKPDVLSDFSYLYMRAEKLSGGAALSLFDSPDASVATSKDTAAAIRLFYWLEHVYKLHEQNVNNANLEYRRYRRSADNTLSETYDVLSYDRTKTYAYGNENCHAVYSSPDNGTGASGILGYFSPSGKLFDASWKAITAN